MPFDFDYCIVGAGPSGLCCAYKLLQAGKTVLLIERDHRVGGLAKSHRYGGHIFDTGPKRFHTDDPVVMAFIKEVSANELSRIGRSTEVYFLERYFNWPLTSGDLFKLPPATALRCLKGILNKVPIRDKASFHDYIRSRYGEALYSNFFKPYTEKFLRWDTEDIHSDWASTGINRTIIDSRIKADNLWAILKSVLLPQKIKTEFLYPMNGGFGGFYEQLLQLCQNCRGFRLSLNDTVTSIQAGPENLKVDVKSGEDIICGDLMWSGNINDLLGVLGKQQRLHYLNTVFYNLVCPEQAIPKRRAQWIYVSNGNSLISRITCMKEFAAYTCPKGYYNIICEITDSQRHPRYMANPETYTGQVIEELRAMSFFQAAKSPEDVHINPVKDTYPVYHRNYQKDFAQAAGTVKKFSKRIHLLGRSGAFWYNNSDHSLRFGMEMAQRLLNKDERPFEYRNYFGGHTSRLST